MSEETEEELSRADAFDHDAEPEYDPDRDEQMFWGDDD